MFGDRKPNNSSQPGRDARGMTTHLRADHAVTEDAMTTTPRLRKSQTQVNTTDGNRSQFDGQIAAVNARILNGRRRASFLSTFAFRLWAAASICLAMDGATAAESATICAAADLRLMTLIEAHGEAQDVPVETLAQAFFTVMEARKACNRGQVEAAIKLYEGIPLRTVVSRRQ
jgi:hypothetical protein